MKLDVQAIRDNWFLHMDEEKDTPARTGPPPPDLVKNSPPIPPPSIPAPNLAPPSPISAPPPMSAPVLPESMKERITAEDDADEDDQPGGSAPLNTRIIAMVIDSVVALGIQIAVGMLMPAVLDKLAWLLAFAYLVSRDTLPFLGGQSVGKKAMKLKVVTLDGKSLAGNWEPAVIRNGVLIIPLFALVELYILFSRDDKPERGRRLGDEWAKTKVIVASDPVEKE